MTHVAQHLPPQLLARLEPLDRRLVLRDALALAVDALQRVQEVRRGDGRLGDGDLHLLLLELEVEGPLSALAALLVLLALLVLVFAEVAEGAHRA